MSDQKARQESGATIGLCSEKAERSADTGLFDSAAFRRWIEQAGDAVDESRDDLNTINVFPVPDSDTGTNLSLTLSAVRQAVRQLPDDATVSQIAKVAARAALDAARGNSGVILSQILSGWESAFRGRDTVTTDEVVEAFETADQKAWQSVSAPVEGTMLSTTQAAAKAARDAVKNSKAPATIAAVLAAAAEAARNALMTTQTDGPSSAAKVVDSGAAGVVLVLDALKSAVTQRSMAPLESLRASAARARTTTTRTGDNVALSDKVEVMYTLQCADDQSPEVITQLKADLAQIGDSVVVSGSYPRYRVHVHTTDPHEAVNVAESLGQVTGHNISSLNAPHSAEQSDPRCSSDDHETSSEQVRVPTTEGNAVEVSMIAPPVGGAQSSDVSPVTGMLPVVPGQRPIRVGHVQKVAGRRAVKYVVHVGSEQVCDNPDVGSAVDALVAELVDSGCTHVTLEPNPQRDDTWVLSVRRLVERRAPQARVDVSTLDTGDDVLRMIVT